MGPDSVAKRKPPAEWLLDVSGAVVGFENTINWPAIWKNSNQKKHVKIHLAELRRELSALSMKQGDRARREYAVPFITQLWATTVRNFEQNWRIPSYLYSKILPSTGAVRLPPLHHLPIPTGH
jgi:ATP-binding cassette, subfamily G (WHITE), member 2, PDR